MDSKGAMGFPVRLALAFMLIALCVPSLASLVENLEEDAEVETVGVQVKKIIDNAETCYYGGIGTQTSLDVSIPAGYSIKIGGYGSDRYSISVLKGDEVVKKTYTEHPAMRFLGESRVISSTCELSLLCTNSGEGYGIEANVL